MSVRPRVVLVATTIVLALGLLAPATVLAHGRESACEVGLEAPVGPAVKAGETVTLQGTVTCTGEAQPSEQTVTIYRHSTGTPGSSAVGTATPETSGSFHFTTEALEADSSFYARIQGARSERVSVQFTPLITIEASPGSAETCSAVSRELACTVTVSGTVSLGDAGARVALERRGGDEGGWHTIAIGKVETDGHYSVTHTFGIAGTANLRVFVHARRKLLSGFSETLTYQITPRATAHPHGQGSSKSSRARG